MRSRSEIIHCLLIMVSRIDFLLIYSNYMLNSNTYIQISHRLKKAPGVVRSVKFITCHRCLIKTYGTRCLRASTTDIWDMYPRTMWRQLEIDKQFCNCYLKELKAGYKFQILLAAKETQSEIYFDTFSNVNYWNAHCIIIFYQIQCVWCSVIISLQYGHM